MGNVAQGHTLHRLMLWLNAELSQGCINLGQLKCVWRCPVVVLHAPFWCLDFWDVCAPLKQAQGQLPFAFYLSSDYRQIMHHEHTVG